MVKIPHLQHLARWRVKPKEGDGGKTAKLLHKLQLGSDLRLQPKFPCPSPVVFSRVPLLSPSTSSQASSIIKTFHFSS